jgi:hypothetical protein
MYLARINFITGKPRQPRVGVNSQLYRWENGTFVVAQQFPTTGGTDVAVFADAGASRLAVSNSLSADVRFAADVVIYAFDDSTTCDPEEP